MPHIVIEVSPPLLATVDWLPVLERAHRALADRGWAALNDLKSRVAPIAIELCGADRHAQQVIATLTLTNPRPPAICEAMAQTLLEHLSQALSSMTPPLPWLQCCVFLRQHPKADYLKHQWHAPAAPPNRTHVRSPSGPPS